MIVGVAQNCIRADAETQLTTNFGSKTNREFDWISDNDCKEHEEEGRRFRVFDYILKSPFLVENLFPGYFWVSFPRILSSPPYSILGCSWVSWKIFFSILTPKTNQFVAESMCLLGSVSRRYLVYLLYNKLGHDPALHTDKRRSRTASELLSTIHSFRRLLELISTRIRLLIWHELLRTAEKTVGLFVETTRYLIFQTI